MSGLWLGLGILQSAVVWFGLHDGQVWALWVVAAAELAQLAGWIAFGVQTRDWYAPLFIVNAIIIVPATVLGWIGLH